ncbi:MAG: heparinase II/III family protein [Kiritimatiellia bacterium]
MLGYLLAMLAVTNMPPPYYTVYAEAVGAPLAKQIEFLAMPQRENVRANSTYVNTRRYLLGPDNPGFVVTPDGSGLGAHGTISMAALEVQAATTENAAEAARCRTLAQWLAHPQGESPRARIVGQTRSSLARAARMPHPRVFATAADFAALGERAKTDALVKAGVDRVLAEAARWRGRPVSTYELTGYHLLAVSRQSMSRLVSNAFAYRLTGERQYVDDAVSELRAVCAFPDWNPRHTIDTGEMMLAVATAYDWLHETLPDDVREQAARALIEKGICADVPNAGWTRLQNNWVQVVAGGLTAAAVAVADRAADLCVPYLVAVVESLPEAESVCGPDGIFPEGPVYWNYGWSFNAIALDVMRTAFGGDFGLSDVPGVRATGLYPAQVTGPSGDWFNYSDCHGSRGSSPAVWWFARRFGATAAVTANEVTALRAVCADCAKPLDRTFPFTLFWTGDDLAKAASPLPDVWVGRGEVPIGVLRMPSGAYLAIKGGSPSYNHGHADAGGFVLDLQGERWGYDLGAENYHAVERHIGPSGLWSPEPESKRWSVFRLGTQGHNTLMIGGKGQDARGFALLTRAGETVVADLSSIYPQARRVVRTVARGPQGFAITDEIEGAEPGSSVRWAMNTNARIGIGADGMVTLRKNGKSIRLFETTGGGVWSEASAQPPNDWESPNPGMRQLVYTAPVPPSGRLVLSVRFQDDGNSCALPVNAFTDVAKREGRTAHAPGLRAFPLLL